MQVQRRVKLAAAAALFLTLSALSCRPVPTVTYQNAPDGPDPEVTIVAVDTTGGASPSPTELDVDGVIAIASGAQTMLFGRGSHSAGIATLKLRLIHDNNVVNVATLKQTAPLGTQVANPAMIFASDGAGNAGAQVPFSFKMTDTKYWADIVATDAAGHMRTIKVTFAMQRRPGGGGGGSPSGGTVSGGNNNDGNTSTGTNKCQCPNLSDPACGGAFGVTCTKNADCAPTMACLVDPAEPHERKYCQQQNLQCKAPVCYKPTDLTYDRTKCPAF